mgnify:CR=1 FL=1
MNSKIPIKNASEIANMRKSGQILAEALRAVCSAAKAGISTADLDKIAEEVILKAGGKPAFKGYHGFPATICSAVNEIIVHGIPSPKQILREGDLFTVDCGVIYNEMYSDAARSIGIGVISKEKNRLIETAKLALSRGIDAAQEGNYVGDISRVIDQTINEAGFKVIHDLTGHGLGYTLHEPPIIANYWNGSKGPKLLAGMTIAIEPIFAVSTHKMITLDDDWTIVTADNSCSVQEENTILITKNGPEVLTN